jgi:formylglycine-generating enzyme required for sulfatase activity
MWPLNGNLAERTVSWNGASEYIDSMNRTGYSGHANWRLPSREELETLVGYVQEQGFGNDPVRTVAAGLHALGMKNISDQEYWTSTEHIYNSGEAWFINLRHGRAGIGMKTLYFSILPVRSVP